MCEFCDSFSKFEGKPTYLSLPLTSLPPFPLFFALLFSRVPFIVARLILTCVRVQVYAHVCLAKAAAYIGMCVRCDEGGAQRSLLFIVSILFFFILCESFQCLTTFF